jgi:hypothetical protein
MIIGITADYVQYIIHTGVLITSLCSVSSLSERVSYVQTGCGTFQPLIQKVQGFFPGGKVAKVKNEWNCTSSPLLCLHGMDKRTFLNTGFHSGRL